MEEEKGFAPEVTLEFLRRRLSDFAKERDWEKFHTPRNLILALMGEVGELSEIFQWKGEVEPGLPNFSEKEIQNVSEELADVLMYLIRLSDRCGIDLAKATIDKLEKNGQKYPADLVRGSEKKYTEYRQHARENKANDS